tara:strand:- start:1051 stop:1233 length:183 start_codon:yes stop_codon:yes gene_type:complete
MNYQDKIGCLIAWTQGQIFTTGVLVFSEDLFKAFMLGFVGGLGGLFVRFIWRFFEKSGDK